MIRVQILDKAVRISFGADALGKSMWPSVLFPAMRNIRTDWFLLSWLGNQCRRKKTLISN